MKTLKYVVWHTNFSIGILNFLQEVEKKTCQEDPLFSECLRINLSSNKAYLISVAFLLVKETLVQCLLSFYLSFATSYNSIISIVRSFYLKNQSLGLVCKRDEQSAVCNTAALERLVSKNLCIFLRLLHFKVNSGALCIFPSLQILTLAAPTSFPHDLFSSHPPVWLLLTPNALLLVACWSSLASSCSWFFSFYPITRCLLLSRFLVSNMNLWV